MKTLAYFCILFLSLSLGLVAKTPDRIVSLAPVATEFLFALGLGDKIVGVTTYCDRPKEASTITKIGGFANPQVESIIKLKPDLVVATPFGNAKQTIATLEKQGIKTIAPAVETLGDMKHFLNHLGEATECILKAREIQATFESTYANFKNKFGLPKPKILILVSTSPLIAAGPNTFAGEIIAHLGAQNVVKTTTPSWPILSLETLIKNPPDFVLISEGEQARQTSKVSLKALLQRHPHVRLLVPETSILQRPGPFLNEDIEILLKTIQNSHG